jgi:hypothetical protein
VISTELEDDKPLSARTAGLQASVMASLRERDRSPVEYEAPNCLLRMLYPVQKPDVGLGESVGSRTFPQQRNVAQ